MSPSTSQGAYYKASLVYFPSQDAICASAMPQGVSTMWSSGTKRKLEEEESLSYFDQRQSVLNISMIKLHAQPVRKTEPPLRRSVLIFNTLKTIETELNVEGVRWSLPTRPSLLPSIQPNDLMLDPLPANDLKSAIADRGAIPSSEKHVAMETNTNDSYRPTNDPESQEMPPEVDSGSLYVDNKSILDSFFGFSVPQHGPLPTFSSLLDLDFMGSNAQSLIEPSPSGSTCHNAFSSTQSSTTNTPSVPLSSTITSPSFSHTWQHSTSRSQPVAPNLESDVFSDHDFSALDLDFFSFLPTNLKLPPLSPEDLQSLPHPETFSQNLSASCNPKHSDLLGDDLDSIMQILVGM